MAIKPLSPPPFQQPFDLANGRPNTAWAQWFQEIYRWMGQSSGTSPLNISGNAATATNASGLPPIMNAGTPEGNQQAAAGATYIDTDTNIVYLKSVGDDTTGWVALT